MSHRTIYKFTCEHGNFTRAIPRGAQFLRVACQKSGLFAMWFLVDPRNEDKEWRFEGIFTGQEFDKTGMTYLGTAENQQGIVLHLFNACGGEVSGG